MCLGEDMVNILDDYDFIRNPPTQWSRNFCRKIRLKEARANEKMSQIHFAIYLMLLEAV